MLYKVGDRVRILDALWDSRETFVPGIEHYCGREGLVTEVVPLENGTWYSLDVDDGEFLWRESELERDFEVGDEVQVAEVPAEWYPKHYSGKETVVKEKFRLSSGMWYTLEIDGGELCWRASDLILLDHQETNLEVDIGELRRVLEGGG